MSTLHGILVVDKPAGPTSHDIVAAARRIFRTRDVGHAGTLDPMARGVLMLLFGQATKLSRFLTLDDKRYRARVRFGLETDTLDATGTVTRRETPRSGRISQKTLLEAVATERLRTRQVPPAVSALKIAGRRAYELQRRQSTPLELHPRDVSVRALVLESFDDESAVFDLTVSKGYYVRAFARDLAGSLGSIAHLDALLRIASGPFSLDEALRWPLSGTEALMTLEEGAGRVLPTAHLTPEGAQRAAHGQQLGAEHFAAIENARHFSAWLGPRGRLIAVGRREDDGTFRVERGFGLVS